MAGRLRLPCVKMPRNYTDDEINQALKDANGNIAAAARALNCSRHTIYEHKKTSPAIAKTWEEGRKYVVEIAKRNLQTALEGGEGVPDWMKWKATEFTLRTLGKDEGFTERHEQTGKDGGPVQVEVPDAKLREIAKDVVRLTTD